MVALTTIEAIFVTSNAKDAESDGAVYLGICGREFHCDKRGPDFDRGGKDVYRFGKGANVVDPAMNDPSKPQLLVEDADLFPVYVRFEQGTASHWKLDSVEVQLNGDDKAVFWNKPLNELWMGLQAGAFCYLRKKPPRG